MSITELLLTALIAGLPALAVGLVGGYLFTRARAADARGARRRSGRRVGRGAEAVDREQHAELHRNIQYLTDQLIAQREVLAAVLRDRAQQPGAAPTSAPPTSVATQPVAAQQAAPQLSGAPTPAATAEPQPELGAPTEAASAGGPSAQDSRRRAIAELLAEGLSERAVARQLQIGLEEVRMAATQHGPPQPGGSRQFPMRQRSAGQGVAS